MTTLSRDQLYFNQLPSTEGELYAPSASTKGLVHRIDLFNTGSSTETITMIKTNGSTPLPIDEISLLSKARVALVWNNEGEVVPDGWAIRGNTTTASTVTCTITGTTES